MIVKQTFNFNLYFAKLLKIFNSTNRNSVTGSIDNV